MWDQRVWDLGVQDLKVRNLGVQDLISPTREKGWQDGDIKRHPMTSLLGGLGPVFSRESSTCAERLRRGLKPMQLMQGTKNCGARHQIEANEAKDWMLITSYLVLCG